MAGQTAKSSEYKKNNDDCSVGSTKSMADLQKDNERLKQQLKLTKAALVTTISEGNKSDLLDDEGSSSFNAAMAMVQDKYPDLHDGKVMHIQ